MSGACGQQTGTKHAHCSSECGTSWLKRKPGTPELSLERPLFDTEVYVNGEKKYVLPDFIVTARAPDGKTVQSGHRNDGI